MCLSFSYLQPKEEEKGEEQNRTNKNDKMMFI